MRLRAVGVGVGVGALAAAALAAALLVAGGGDDARGPLPADAIALAPFDEGIAGEQAEVSLPTEAGGTARLRASGLRPSKAGEFYELWLIAADGRRLQSLGTFRVGADGFADVTVPVGVDPKDFALVDLSVEPADGDPGHAAHSVLRADLRPA